MSRPPRIEYPGAWYHVMNRIVLIRVKGRLDPVLFKGMINPIILRWEPYYGLFNTNFLIVHLGLVKPFCGFLITLYIVVLRFGVKPVISPTKLKLSIVIKIYDIIFPGFQAAGDAICYVSPVLTPLQTVRYMKHTCTLAEFHILASPHLKSTVKFQ